GHGAHVHSAGLLEGGRAVTDDGLSVMAARGLDTSGHLSRCISPAMLSAADLILGMTRDHVREAVLLVPLVWPRTFTLKELVRRGRAVGPRPGGMALRGWLDLVGRGRERGDLLGDSPADDVADPVGQGRDAYQRTADELDGLTRQLAALVWARCAPASATTVRGVIPCP
ncbi:MAG TPA: hypothetical protein VF954_05710, partial [Acidimicrobiales bacterium]